MLNPERGRERERETGDLDGLRLERNLESDKQQEEFAKTPRGVC